jgi:hypothetical protein
MTVYELAMTIPDDQRESLVNAGIIPQSVARYLYIYKYYLSCLDAGKSKMEAYEATSQKCFTCVENVRKIILRMGKEV